VLILLCLFILYFGLAQLATGWRVLSKHEKNTFFQVAGVDPEFNPAFAPYVTHCLDSAKEIEIK
jgi:hypothetical protein